MDGFTRRFRKNKCRSTLDQDRRWRFPHKRRAFGFLYRAQGVPPRRPSLVALPPDNRRTATAATANRHSATISGGPCEAPHLFFYGPVNDIDALLKIAPFRRITLQVDRLLGFRSGRKIVAWPRHGESHATKRHYNGRPNTVVSGRCEGCLGWTAHAAGFARRRGTGPGPPSGTGTAQRKVADCLFRII